MDWSFSRRDLLYGMTVAGSALGSKLITPPLANAAGPIQKAVHRQNGWVEGRMTGAMSIVETLIQEGTECVYGIPGAQENELWDAFKTRNLPYLLVTHEFSAACMADGYARSTGKPGVMCIVPGPGVTNSLSGLGEALIDSIPIVCIVGDIARGAKYRPFQVHCLDQIALLKPVTKEVYDIEHVSQIPDTIRKAFALARAGEPGPVAVVIPYTMLIEAFGFHSPPLPSCLVAYDENATQTAIAILQNQAKKIGIYAGQGCMDYSTSLVQVAEMLQAPVATSVSGKGAFPECHALSVGWGYGPHATLTAQEIFSGRKLHPREHGVDIVLAIGVRYSEVSTGFYGNPTNKFLIHVDANENNIGKAIRADLKVHADSGVFLAKLLENRDTLQRPINQKLVATIQDIKKQEFKERNVIYSEHGVDPMLLINKLRAGLSENALVFVDVTVSEHLAAEGFQVTQPRTYFNPTDNQAMGWSIPAAIGAQKVRKDRQVITITGDGCLLMSAMEISTAAREQLGVKFFILDDQAYHYMQMFQKPAYLRTTATILSRLDYAALAKGWGVGYLEIAGNDQIEGGIRAALAYQGPVFVRVLTDYGKRKIRWIEAVRKKYVKELNSAQKARFLSRVGTRAIELNKEND